MPVDKKCIKMRQFWLFSKRTPDFGLFPRKILSFQTSVPGNEASIFLNPIAPPAKSATFRPDNQAGEWAPVFVCLIQTFERDKPLFHLHQPQEGLQNAVFRWSMFVG